MFLYKTDHAAALRWLREDVVFAGGANRTQVRHPHPADCAHPHAGEFEIFYHLHFYTTFLESFLYLNLIL